jgi:predicted NBD/HSP70 family sugar kinase
VPVQTTAGTRAAVLSELLATGTSTRSAVAARTGLSGATVTRTVEALIAEGLARETHTVPANNGRGRRATLLEPVGERANAVGVDLGASNTRLVATDLMGKPTAVRRTPTPGRSDSRQLALWLAEFIRESLDERWPLVEALALGLPGAVRPSDRSVSNAPHLSQVEDSRFLDVLEEQLGRPVLVDNDANYALLGESYFGAARGAPSAVMFTVGSGLGAGVTVDGRLVRGINGLVGEFGALPIGPPGLRLEHMITGAGIMLRASELGIPMESPADLFVSDPSVEVSRLRRQFEETLIIALIAAVVSCDPEVIVLGGGISPSLEGSTEALRMGVQAHLGTAPPIAIGELGDISGAVGASVQALHTIYLGLGIPSDQLSRMPRRGASWEVA